MRGMSRIQRNGFFSPLYPFLLTFIFIFLSSKKLLVAERRSDFTRLESEKGLAAQIVLSLGSFFNLNQSPSITSYHSQAQEKPSISPPESEKRTGHPLLPEDGGTCPYLCPCSEHMSLIVVPS